MGSGIDYFISYSQAQKLALLQGLTESILTGQVVKVQTAPGVFTEFDAQDTNNDLLYQRLCDSIANDCDFDASDPTQVKCRKNQRPGITRGNFSGC